MARDLPPEPDIVRCILGGMRSAAACCYQIARGSPPGMLIGTMSEAIKDIEGGYRQLGYSREDYRYFQIADRYGASVERCRRMAMNHPVEIDSVGEKAIIVHQTPAEDWWNLGEIWTRNAVTAATMLEAPTGRPSGVLLPPGYPAKP